MSQWTKTSFRVLKGEKVIGEYVLTAAPSAVYGTDGRFSGTLSSGLVQDSFWKAVRQIPGGTDMTGTKLVVTAIVNGVTYTVTANATGAGKFVNIPEVVTAPPKTGDDSRSLSGLLLMLSGLILAAAVLRNRKEQAGL
jgi:LPXTG-motif cell wall-anchored protein